MAESAILPRRDSLLLGGQSDRHGLGIRDPERIQPGHVEREAQVHRRANMVGEALATLVGSQY